MKNKKIPLAFFFGTEAELIKSFPVILELRNRGFHPYIIASGQNDLVKSSISQEFDLLPDCILNPFQGKKMPRYVFIWYIKTLFLHFFQIKKYFKQHKIQYVVVHGDTLSTLMGAIFARLAGLEVWHLEGGLRSFDWWNPFPEEIDRFIVGHLSRVHFCQNHEALKNVENHKGDKIFTEGNVIYDVVDMYANKNTVIEWLPKKDFSVITFHRAETLYKKEVFQILIDTLFESAKKIPTIFVLFEATKEMIMKENGLLEKIQNHPNIIIQPRLPYETFCILMKKARFIITDGGSNQEELAHLGTPTLIMRKKTERTDGIGKNIVISHLQFECVKDFLNNYQKYDYKGEKQGSPTKIIVDYIVKRI